MAEEIEETKDAEKTGDSVPSGSAVKETEEAREANEEKRGKGKEKKGKEETKGIAGFWRTRTRRAKVRLVFYPSLVAIIAGFLFFTMSMPGSSYHGELPALELVQRSNAVILKHDVEVLAGEIGERHMNRGRSLETARRQLGHLFADSGFASKDLGFDVDGTTVSNIEAVLEGTSKPKEIVVIGAHYDTAAGAPGADDNASGVALLFALMRAFDHKPQARTIRFVAFVNEEPPHFWNASMGSLHYAKSCKEHNDDVVAMLSLESLGYYRDEPGSQKYPPVISWFYPDRGDFVAFVGNMGSRSLVREAIGEFRKGTKFPSEGAAMPGFVSGVGWSDHWSFWQVGYPALMVTDTAPFRNPSYHTPDDKPGTLDYDRMARVATGLTAVVRKLANP